MLIVSDLDDGLNNAEGNERGRKAEPHDDDDDESREASERAGSGLGKNGSICLLCRRSSRGRYFR